MSRAFAHRGRNLSSPPSALIVMLFSHGFGFAYTHVKAHLFRTVGWWVGVILTTSEITPFLRFIYFRITR